MEGEEKGGVTDLLLKGKGVVIHKGLFQKKGPFNMTIKAP